MHTWESIWWNEYFLITICISCFQSNTTPQLFPWHGIVKTFGYPISTWIHSIFLTSSFVSIRNKTSGSWNFTNWRSEQTASWIPSLLQFQLKSLIEISGVGFQPSLFLQLCLYKPNLQHVLSYSCLQKVAHLDHNFLPFHAYLLH